MSADALACVELASIARGVRLVDVMVKRASVALRHHGRHSGGKYVILVEGPVANVEEAYEDALQHAGDHLIDHMMLPHAHSRLWAALDGRYDEPDDRAAVMVETIKLAGLLRNLDFAVKLVDAAVIDLQIAAGIAGKGYFAVQAELHDAEYLRDELLVRIPDDELVEIELIANPHPEMLTAFGHPGPFRSGQ